MAVRKPPPQNSAAKRPAVCPLNATAVKPRRQAVQPLELIGFVVTNRGIPTAFAITSGQHIPDSETMREHALQPRVVRHRSQRLVQSSLPPAARIGCAGGRSTGPPRATPRTESYQESSL